MVTDSDWFPLVCCAMQIHKVDTLVSYKNDEWDDEQ